MASGAGPGTALGRTSELRRDGGGPWWPTFGSDASNTGCNGDTTDPGGEVGVLDSVPVPGYASGRGSRFVVRDGTLYLPVGPRVRAVSVETGSTRWSTRPGRSEDARTSTPAVTEDAVYVTDSEGRLYALARGTGERRWEAELGDVVHSAPPTVAHGSVFAGGWYRENGSVRGELYAVSTGTGEVIWRRDAGTVMAPPAVDTTRVYVSDGRSVSAYRAEDGREAWQTHPGGEVQAAPAVVHGTVVSGAGTAEENGALFALDADDGSERWQLAIDGDSMSYVWYSPTVVGDLAYAAATDGRVYAVSLADGALEWSYGPPDNPPQSTGPLAASADTVYSTDGNSLTALDASSGTERWTYRGSVGRALPASGRLYVSGRSDDDTAVVRVLGDVLPREARAAVSELERLIEEVRGSDLSERFRPIYWEADYGEPLPSVREARAVVRSAERDIQAGDYRSARQRAERGLRTQRAARDARRAIVVAERTGPLTERSAPVGDAFGRTELIGHAMSAYHDGRYTEARRLATEAQRAERNGLYVAAGGVVLGAAGVGGANLYGRSGGSSASDGADRPDDAGLGGSEPTDAPDLHERAAEARDRAESAAERGEIDAALEAYDDAVDHYRELRDRPDAGSEGTPADEEAPANAGAPTDAAAALAAVREDRDALERRRSVLTDVEESLETAERRLHEGIEGHLEGRRTVARISYRQARDQYDRALERLEEADVDGSVLDGPALSVSGGARDAALPADLRTLVGSDSTVAALEDAGIETVAELRRADPARIDGLETRADLDGETVARLRAVGWWEDESLAVTDRATIERRRDRADDGFRACK